MRCSQCTSALVTSGLLGQHELITVHHASGTTSRIGHSSMLTAMASCREERRTREGGRKPYIAKYTHDITIQLSMTLILMLLFQNWNVLNRGSTREPINVMATKGKTGPTEKTSPGVTRRNCIGVHGVAILFAAGDQREILFPNANYCASGTRDNGGCEFR